MKHVVAVITAVSLLLTPVSAAGAGPCTRAVVVSPGHKAVPCTGLLIPPAQATQALLCLEEHLPTCVVNAKVSADKFTLRVEHLETLLSEHKQNALRLEGLLDEAVSVPPPEPPWYEGGLFWGITGAVVGLVLGGALVYGVFQLEAARGEE